PLDLAVARALEEFLAIALGRSEGGAGFRLPRGERLGGAGALANDAHATPAAARRGLEDQGITDRVGKRDRLVRVLQGLFAAGHDWNAGLLGDLSRLRLVTHQTDRLG